MFKAILIEGSRGGDQQVALKSVDETQLPEGDVTVEVAYSTLNYKDALAITGKAPIAKTYPMVPGIDLAGGVVTESDNPDFKPGDQVVLNGWGGVGEKHWGGGLAEKARLSGDWLIPLQAPFTPPRQAMAIGTAGYTAMLCVIALEKQGVKPDSGDILVTGATGGVGSVAVAILAKLGYSVTAVTGRPEEEGYLKSLGGAKQILDRAELTEPGKPLARETWAGGAIDVAGGQVLANVCAAMKYRGVVAACGLAAGMDFPATVAPFILRGVTLCGVDSVMAPKADRLYAWKRLAEDLSPPELLDSMITEVSFDDAIGAAGQLLEGKLRGGRVVIPVAVNRRFEQTENNRGCRMSDPKEQPISRFPVPELGSLPSDIRDRILKVQEKSGGFIPNVFLALAHRPPDEFRAFFDYHDALMEKESNLTKAEREMIVVATSNLNQCQYCVVAHGAILRIREKNPLIADQVAVNYRKADISERQKAMLDFAVKVSQSAYAVNEDDFATLRAHGFTDEDAWDITGITAFFGLSNRMANVTSMRANPEFYSLGGR